MSVSAVLTSSLRKGQNLRIIVVVIIFFFLASISQYQVSFEFSIDSDGQVQSVPSAGEHDIYYTHHIATYNPKDIKPWTKGDTRALETLEGQEVAAFLTAAPSVKTVSSTGQPELVDNAFLHLTKRLRVFRSLWTSLKDYYDQLEDESQQNRFYDQPQPSIAPAVELFQKMERSLFPWILKNHHTSYDLYFETTKATRPADSGQGTTKNRGIVMCVGDKHSVYARTTVKVLREVLQSKLPIEIYYAGDQDLSKENREWFEQFQDLVLVDITKKLDQDMLQISGPIIKPFAMLVSQFQEVILMDADAYFLQDPAILFEDGGYKEVGTVFFYDRTVPKKIAGVNKRAWLDSFLPSVSNHPSKTRWFRFKGDQDQDSGVVVLDKSVHFLGLLAICKMNDVLERNQATYRATWGEKESFWIGMEMIQERYSFVRFGGGVIGDLGDAVPYKQDDKSSNPADSKDDGSSSSLTALSSSSLVRRDRVCGNQLHFNYKGQPLWWNSGLVRDKSTDNSPYLKYTAWIRDEHGIWDIEHSCLVQTFHGALMEVEWNQRQTIYEMLRLDRAVAEELNQPKVKNILAIPRLVKAEGAKGGKGNNEAV
ncbi:hypothetical protein BGZ80_009101 [Entomortierella chlamydospora]|uniref:Glycosyltransferase family 71 protein n=1 Tax=Entomortierella chlamydospora TaxID=101097 RepID=A0A9P6T449_9FUNG|nr:hypothetical protein BGZ80_009101 [Entomortierella chlamydospora]